MKSEGHGPLAHIGLAQIGVEFLRLDRRDPERTSRSFSNFADVPRIGGDDAVASADRPLDHGNIDDVVMPGFTDQGPDPLSQFLAHRLDVTHPQHPSQVRLPRPATPCLGKDGGRDHGDDLFGNEACVQLPHLAIVALGGDKHAGVIGNPAHRNQAEFRSTLP
jgi:hypothetical protein